MGYEIINGVLKAYKEEQGVTDIIIPDGVTSIGSWAFCKCTNLTNIVIPDGVTSIGNGAFENCKTLKSIVIPDSVTEIGERAFFGCDNLTCIGCFAKDNWLFSALSDSRAKKAPYDVLWRVKSGHISSYRLMDWMKADKTVIVTLYLNERDSYPEEDKAVFEGYLHNQRKSFAVTAVKKQNCRLLGALIDRKLIDIKQLPELIQDAVAYKNAEVTAMLLEYQNSGFDAGEKAKEEKRLKRKAEADIERAIGIKPPTVADMKKIWSVKKNPTTDSLIITRYKGSETSIVVPDRIGQSPVTSIGDKAFKGCHRLTSIVIPDSVTSIGDNAFAYCSDLTCLVIPKSVTSIGNSAFEGCKKLRR